MPRETSSASFGTDYRRARSQERGSNCVGIHASLARRYEASIRLVHVIELLHHSLHVSQSKSRQSKIEERVTNSGSDLEEIVESRIDCRRRIDYEVRIGNPFFELILAACAWHADLIVGWRSEPRTLSPIGQHRRAIGAQIVRPGIGHRQTAKPDRQAVFSADGFFFGS